MRGRCRGIGSILLLLGIGSLSMFALGAFPQDIDDRAAFTVGDFVITRYEVPKNATRSIDLFRYEKESLPSQEWMEKWFADFLDRSYFLEDAREKGYFGQSSVESAVAAMARVIVTQNRGLLFKELVNNVSATEAEMRDAYNKAQTNYTFSLIHFENRNALDRVAGRDTIDISPLRFREWYSVTDNPDQQDVSCGCFTLSWPFWNYPELETTIMNLPENAVAGPVSTNDGLYYVLMEKKEKQASLPPYETIQKRLEDMVRLYKEVTIMERFRNDILREADVSVQTRAFEDVFSLLLAKGGRAVPYPEYEGNGLPLFSYRCTGHVVNMNAGEFLRYCGSMILNEKIDSPAVLRKRINQVAYEMCAYAEAEKRGITQTEQFILDRKNFANSVVYDAYVKAELASTQPLSDMDMQREYTGFPERYKDGVSVRSAYFVFKSTEDAQKGSGKIFQQYKEQGHDREKDWVPRNLDGLVSVTPDFTVRHDSSDIPPAVKGILFGMMPGQVTAALDMGNGTYGVFVKESETGSRIRSFDEVRDEIRKNVAADRLKLNKEARLKELKRKYPIKFDVPKETLLKSILESHPELSASGG